MAPTERSSGWLPSQSADSPPGSSPVASGAANSSSVTADNLATSIDDLRLEKRACDLTGSPPARNSISPNQESQSSTNQNQPFCSSTNQHCSTVAFCQSPESLRVPHIIISQSPITSNSSSEISANHNSPISTIDAHSANQIARNVGVNQSRVYQHFSVQSGSGLVVLMPERNSSSSISQFLLAYQPPCSYHDCGSIRVIRSRRSGLSNLLPYTPVHSARSPVHSIANHKLQRSARYNDPERVRSALSSGADIDFQDSAGRSALHFAAAQGYSDVVEVLLGAGAKPDLVDRRGNTPLHLAITTSRWKTVELLLDKGANVWKTNSAGLSTLQMARQKIKMAADHVKMATGRSLNTPQLPVDYSVIHRLIRAAGFSDASDSIHSPDQLTDSLLQQIDRLSIESSSVSNINGRSVASFSNHHQVAPALNEVTKELFQMTLQKSNSNR